jgi:succinoglycan biosynthesis transport protein ExoP
MTGSLSAQDDAHAANTLMNRSVPAGQMVFIPQEGNTAAPGPVTKELKLGDLVMVLRRWQRLMLTVFAATVTLGALITLQQRLFWPVYQGDFRLLVSDPIDPGGTASPDNSLKTLAMQPQSRTNTPVLIEMLTSPVLLQPIAQKLDIPQEAIAKNLTIISKGDGSGVLEVSLRWPAADEGQRILEALSGEYLAFSLRQRQERLAQGLTFLDSQAPVLQQKVVDLQQQLSAFRRQNGFIDPSIQGEAIQTRQQELKTRADDLRQTEAKLLGMASAVRSGKLTGSELQSAGSDPLSAMNKPTQGSGSGGLQGNLADLEKQLAEAEASFLPSSPQVRSLRSRVNTLRPLLQQRQMDAIQTALSENRSELAEVNRQSQQLSRQFAMNPNLIRKYEAIEQRMEIARTNLTTYIKTREDFRLEVAQRTQPWSLLSAPEFETSPDKPNLRNNLLLSLLAGGVIGVGAALVRDRFDHGFRRSQEVEEALDLPLLGSLPFLPLEAGLNITQAVEAMEPGERFGLKESLRNLFTTFRQLPTDKVLRVIALTSTVELEGKSTASVLLAQTLAELGQRVLLVDADLRRPSLHRLIGVKNGEGLYNLLTEPSLDPVRLIRRINERLDLITAGSAPLDATKVLSSVNCSGGLAALRALPDYDMVLFDTPPSLALSDAVLLGEHLDGMVFLVSLMQVDRDLPIQALRRIRSSGVEVLGMITNQVAKTGGIDGYSYSYGYSYGPSPTVAEAPLGANGAQEGWQGGRKLLGWLNQRG